MIINKYIKISVAIVLLGLAVLRWVYFDAAKERMDSIFLGLVVFALLAYFIPWEHIKTFKAGSIELSLEQSPVKAAIIRLGLDRINDQGLKEELSKLENEVQAIRGGRVLWIDDKPHRITGERRLLRALGIQVVSAISSEAAMEILEADNDFDLIISDVQRIGESYQITGGIEIHEGTNFIVRLRQHEDVTIQTIPVVFYAAYPWESLVEFTKPARQIKPEPEISNSVIDFVPKVIRQLALSRTTPIIYSEKKEPTSVRWNKNPTHSKLTEGMEQASKENKTG
jgi:CheY-like chemotaxis protein